MEFCFVQQRFKTLAIITALNELINLLKSRQAILKRETNQEKYGGEGRIYATNSLAIDCFNPVY